MWLLLLLAGETLWLENGRSLACDHYARKSDTLLVTVGEQVYSLPERLVDWERTAREKAKQTEPPPPQADPVEPGRDEPKYTGFVIQRLDVKRTSLIDLLRFLADMVGINLYIDGSVADRKVTYLFTNIPWDQALTIILFDAGLDYQIHPSMLHVRG